MKHTGARQVGEELKPYLERLKALIKEEKSRRGIDSDAIEIATVNLSSAIDILTE